MLFTRDDLLRVLHGMNPWWNGRTPSLPQFRRPIYHACRRHVEARSENFVQLISGLRGTGKTTMLRQLAADVVAAGLDARSVLYLDVGHPIFSRVPLPQILRIHREMIYVKDRPAVLLLDELHYARDWDQHVKAVLSDKAGYRIVATESVQMIERALVTETQLVRWSPLSSPTLSFHEYLTMHGLDPVKGKGGLLDLGREEEISDGELSKVARAIRPALPHFRAYLVAGGLPEVSAGGADAKNRGTLHEDAVENILRRDIALHFGARNIEDLKRLFVFLCMRSGDVFPVQRYARAVEVSAATVANHLDLLERCFLIRRIAPIGAGNTVVRKARYRVFVSDTTLRSAQLLRDEDSLSEPEEMQRVVATSVIRHAVERYVQSLADFRYWRDVRTGSKVDLIVRDQGRKIVFQMLYEPPRPLEQDDPLLAYCRRDKVDRAFLVTQDEDDIDVFRLPGIPTEFVKVPAHVLTYLLGRAESRSASQ